MTTEVLPDEALAAARARADAHVMATYPVAPAAFVAGEGSWLVDVAGERWLDLLCGLAVTSLGHAHPAVTAAVAEQAGRLVHTSNLYLTEPALELAERLATVTGWDDATTFFAQCGATANEAALKLARRHGKAQHPDKVRVVTLSGSFHGRTMATLEATGQPAKHVPFAPLAGFVDTVAWDDAEALRAAVTDDHCAVLLEAVQGEGGVRPVPHDVLLAAREACDDHGALLLVDEVQTGIGRTGTWLAFQQTPVVPDVVTLAKALGNGVPIGAVVAHGVAATTFGPGDHATTFGGNPVTCAAANAVLRTIEEQDLLARVRELSARFTDAFTSLADDPTSGIAGVRGMGLLLGVELTGDHAAAAAAQLLEQRVLVNAVAGDTLRLAPPFVLTDDEADRAVAQIAQAVRATAGSPR